MNVSLAHKKQTWNEDELSVEYRPIDKLVPYARNARTHSDAQVEQIAASIKEFGFTNPILIDPKNGIIAGHGRLMAASKMGLKDVPCIELAGLTDAQKQAYVLADNQLAQNAGWDSEVLRQELQELGAADFDLGLIGFSDDDLASYLTETTEGETDPDDVPEIPDEPVTVTGDVWVMGNHRLVCGDSTNADDVAKALNGVSPHLMVTDPPYGVEYKADWREKALGGKRADGAVENDDNADWSEAWALFPGDVAYVWHADKMGVGVGVGQNLMDCGFNLRAMIIWSKSQFAIGRGDYHAMHEPCWYAVRKTGKGHWNGDRKQTTVWNIDKPNKSETGHSTQKPVECMRRPIVNNSSPGQAVYEPFCGSGTTIIAGEMEGRHIHALELSPAYCDVIVKRWQDFTGKEATRESDGKKYNET